MRAATPGGRASHSPAQTITPYPMSCPAPTGKSSRRPGCETARSRECEKKPPRSVSRPPRPLIRQGKHAGSPRWAIADGTANVCANAVQHYISDNGVAMRAGSKGDGKPSVSTEAGNSVLRRLNLAIYKHKNAVPIYQYALDHWPTNENAIWQQMNLVICQICLGDSQAADAAIAKLQANYASNPNFRRAACTIGDNLRWRDINTEKAKDMYTVAASGDPYPDILWAKMGLAISSIGSGDPNTAYAILAKLNTQYRDDPGLAQALYEIGGAFSDAKQFDKATQLFNQVITTWPAGGDYAPLSKAGLGLIQVRQGNDAASEAIYQKVLADYPNHARLPDVVRLMAEGYFEKGLRLAGVKPAEGNKGTPKREISETAKTYLRKAIAKWAPLTTGPSASSSPLAAEAQYYTILAYYQLGENQTVLEQGAKLVQQWPNYANAWQAYPLMVKVYKEQIRAGEITPADGQTAIEQLNRQLLEKYPTCPAAAQVRKALAKPQATTTVQKSAKGGEQ